MKRKLVATMLLAMACQVQASVWNDDPDFTEFNSLQLPTPASWNKPIARPAVIRPQTKETTAETKPTKLESTTGATVATVHDNSGTFVPAKAASVMDVKNPEYIARRNAALQKPGAVVGHYSVE